MGFEPFEAFRQQQSLPDIFRIWTPQKTEPDVMRSLGELISMQVLTHQLITQLAAAQTGKKTAFIGTGLRADEGAAFDESANQVRLLSQRVDDLERKLDEATKKAGAAAGARG